MLARGIELRKTVASVVGLLRKMQKRPLSCNHSFLQTRLSAIHRQPPLIWWSPPSSLNISSLTWTCDSYLEVWRVPTRFAQLPFLTKLHNTVEPTKQISRGKFIVCTPLNSVAPLIMNIDRPYLSNPFKISSGSKGSIPSIHTEIKSNNFASWTPLVNVLADDFLWIHWNSEAISTLLQLGLFALLEYTTKSIVNRTLDSFVDTHGIGSLSLWRSVSCVMLRS